MDDLERDMIKLIDKPDLKVYLSSFPSNYDAKQLERRLHLLPDALQTTINKYKDWESRWLRITGKYLLQKICIDMGFENLSSLSSLYYSEKNKPFLSDHIDFSISHSTDKVVCGVIKNGVIGIDIEKKGSYMADDFKEFFNEKEFEIIANGPCDFYKLWTKKEALAKATGMGIFFDFNKHSVVGNEVLVENKSYEFEELPIDESSIGFICVSNLT